MVKLILSLMVWLSVCDLVPSGPPQSVAAVNKSSTELTVSWQNVLEKDRKGIIKGFKVYYAAVGQFAVDTREKVKEVNGGSAMQTVVGGLEKYIEYNITVLAFTSKGDGPNSTEITVRTDQDGMEMRNCHKVFSCSLVAEKLLVFYGSVLCDLDVTAFGL